MAKIDAFFRLMNAQSASDLHLTAGEAPCLRVHGELELVKYRPLENDELIGMLEEICPEPKFKEFQDTGDIDFAYELEGIGRFRANYFQQARGAGAVFRQIPSEILTIEQIGLPPVARRFAMMEKGLVLVTGPTGSGKSTTLAAIIDYANKHRKDHIITVEDPIEFRHQKIHSLINHREIGIHTKGFTAALRGALREDPDIILVGELRDLETIQLALEAAATGHLVFATLHTPNAPKTIDRIIDVFPTDAQEQVRSTLAESLKGVIAQSLFKRADGSGRVSALEILVGTPAVGNLIREGKTHQLTSVLQTNRKVGMCTLDDSIEELLRQGKISAQAAFEKCTSKERFVEHLPSVPEEYQELLPKDGDGRKNSRRSATPAGSRG